jgi:hypothetical protein
MDYRFRTWMLGAALLAALPAFAGSTIYRCHALNGALLFQDRPCNQVPGTREAQAGQEGEVVPPAPPPAEDGGTASGRYTRLIDEADRQQRAQAEADAAEARRLRAERAAAAPPRTVTASTPSIRPMASIRCPRRRSSSDRHRRARLQRQRRGVARRYPRPMRRRRRRAT